jgi:hypothetical protein
MVLFQMTDLEINKAWEISPYNGAAFGALIVVLGGVIWYFHNQLNKKDEIIKEKDELIKILHDKTHEAVDVMSEKLTEIKHSNDNNKEKIIMFLEIIKEKLNKIS